MRPAAFVLLLAVACGPGVGVVDTPKAPNDSTENLFTGDPANDAVYGLDVSMWEGPISESQMDCFWANGVTHLVVGTQVAEVTLQQLDMARRRGMSLDAYVFLHWSQDMTAQVQAALQLVSGYPVGRLWLDVEEQPPAGTKSGALADLLQLAVNACHAQTAVGCGIYTAAWFWNGSMGGTTRFAGEPLWYALYDGRTSLSSWSSDHFGGWTAPAGKQWASNGMCGIGGADHDTIQRLVGPDVVIDRTPSPPPTTVPPAPVNLFPANGQAWQIIPGITDFMKMMVDTIPAATAYQFAVESWSGSSWATYATWTVSTPYMKFSPYFANAYYRFRARAANGYGWGTWSPWSVWEYGADTGAAPDAGTPSNPDAGTTPGADAGPQTVDAGATASDAGGYDAGESVVDAGAADGGSPPGAPTGLSPDQDQGFAAGAAVKLSCTPVASATSYRFEIQYQTGGTWQPYYTYTSSTASQTFWPQVSTAYEWQVQAEVSGAWGPASAWATFDVH